MIVVLFLLGLCLGSFLNVLIDRIPQEESIWKKRSHCDFCRKTLSIIDLFPVLSWIMLNGKCRYCRKDISWQYPVVELSTGLMFLAVFLHQDRLSSGFPQLPSEPILVWFFIILWSLSMLIAVLVTDAKYGIIPDRIIGPTIVLLLIRLGLFHSPNWSTFLNPFLSGFLVMIFFYLLHIGTKGRGMGLGDVKFVFLMGLLLGSARLLIGLYIAFLTGAIVGVILIFGHKLTMKQTIPFGPFLVLGTVLSILIGNWFSVWFGGVLH